MKSNVWLGLFMLLSSIFACRPLITVGWNELAFLFLLVTFLLGPPVYKLIRKIEDRLRKDK